MISTLGLSLIAELMEWDNNEATAEYGWLQLMSSIKYDGYSDFRAGARFFESLATWLRQFRQEDQKTAYDFIRQRLVYISAAEMQRVIEIFVPDTVTPFLRKAAATEAGIKPHEVWGRKEGVEAFNRVLRRSLFIGLSDGSRIDVLRRANAGRLSQEQIVPMMNIGGEKWDDLGNELRKEQGSDARFDNIYLIDDFTASGTTFIRQVEGKWKGKLTKFNDMICKARERRYFPVADDYRLHIHHYISTAQARAALNERVLDASANWTEKSFSDVEISEGCLLPSRLKLNQSEDAAMLRLCEEYYDHQLYIRLKKHCDEAGQTHMKLGYAECAIPLILEHNTPNNSLSILWAETSGRLGHSMEPLFRRRDRHG